MDVDPAIPVRNRGAAWLPRGTIVLLTAAGAVLVIAGLHQIAGIIAPIFLALVLTVAVHPLDGMLRRWGAAPWAALTLTLATIYLILIFLVGAAAFSVARLATVLPQYKGRAQELVDNVSQGLSHLGIGGQQASAGLSDVNVDKVVSALLDVLDGLLGVTANLLLVVTVLFFMALDAAGFTARLQAIHRSDLAGALSGFASGTRRYLVVSTIFGLIVAVLDTIALALIGVPLPVVWGLFSFITNYVPNIGFIIGLIPPALLGLLEGGALDDARGDRRLLRDQRDPPVGHPAEGRRGRGRPDRHALVRVADLLDLGDRAARRDPGHPAERADEGGAAGHGPRRPLVVGPRLTGSPPPVPAAASLWLVVCRPVVC